jgi:hypothetical protein
MVTKNQVLIEKEKTKRFESRNSIIKLQREAQMRNFERGTKLPLDTLKASQERKNTDAYDRQVRLQENSSKNNKYVEGYSILRLLKPAIYAILVIFLIAGPGLTAILYMFNAFKWYMWVGLIGILLLLWRRR